MTVEPEDRSAAAPWHAGDSQLGPVPNGPLSQFDDELMNFPFGRYVLIRKIGAGAMGWVYKAEQIEPVRTVAVKLMKSQHASAEAENRFFRETRLLASLNHPHVAQLYDAGVHREGVLALPFCVMELVWGASSITAFAQNNKLSTRAKIELFLQVCAGVRHVHEHDVLHCDLKPTNILVNGEGQVKVIDFGVARSMRLDGTSGATWSNRSVMFGTPQYMSPEQVQGFDFELDERSDVYALGIVLFELLCGQLPYRVDRTSALTAARSIMDSEPISPRRTDRSLSSDAESVLMRALAKDADERYPTVQALEDDLNRLLRGEPVVPSRHRLKRFKRKSARWIARHRLFVAAAVVLCVTAICGAIGKWLGDAGVTQWVDVMLTERVHHVPSAPLKHVVIIKRTDTTDFAAIGGLLPSDPADAAQNNRLGRRVYGKLLHRLAAAGVKPKAVSFDITFPPDSVWDDELAGGIRAISPVPVNIVDLTSGHRTSIAPKIAPLVSVGSASAVVRADTPWTATLASTLPNGGIFPSLSLLTASQCWRPGETPAMEWQLDSLNLRYSGSTIRQVAVTSVTEFADDDLEKGLVAGTPYADFMVEMPSDAHVDESSVVLQDLFNWTDGQLRDRFDGKVILLGDFRFGVDGPFPHPSGQSFSGPVLNAVTIERLLNEQALKRPQFLSALGAHVQADVLIMLGASICGAVVAWRASRRFGVRTLVYACIGLTIVAATVVCFRVGGYLFSPVAALLCLLAGGEAVALLFRARESTI